MKSPLFVVVLTLSAFAGCSNEPTVDRLPEVNDANCKFEALEKIKNREAREKMAGLCSRRPAFGGVRRSQKPLNWFEFNR